MCFTVNLYNSTRKTPDRRTSTCTSGTGYVCVHSTAQKKCSPVTMCCRRRGPSVTPPSIAIEALVLGGPERVRVCVSQPMFIIRHPRHRTGVHTDAVTISSGTPVLTPVLTPVSQPMFRFRHPRHRTGVHTDAVNTSSGTPGPPNTQPYSSRGAAQKKPLLHEMEKQVHGVLLLLQLSGTAGQCLNTCMYANDGDCDDGGSGAEFTNCPLGTDCFDCDWRHLHHPHSPHE